MKSHDEEKNQCKKKDAQLCKLKTYLSVKPPGISRFARLILIQDKTKLHPCWNFFKIMLHLPLGNSKVKYQDPWWKFHMAFSWLPLKIPLFKINPYKFHMLFLWHPYKFLFHNIPTTPRLSHHFFSRIIRCSFKLTDKQFNWLQRDSNPQPLCW